jgi:hypothetical protein
LFFESKNLSRRFGETKVEALLYTWCVCFVNDVTIARLNVHLDFAVQTGGDCAIKSTVESASQERGCGCLKENARALLPVQVSYLSGVGIDEWDEVNSYCCRFSMQPHQKCLQ